MCYTSRCIAESFISPSPYNLNFKGAQTLHSALASLPNNPAKLCQVSPSYVPDNTSYLSTETR